MKNVTVTVLDAAVKYRIEDTVPGNGKTSLSIGLAKNEREGGQFILRFDEDVEKVYVSVSDIVGENGTVLPVYGLYKEQYIEGMADALIPLCYDDLNGFPVKAGCNQGIFLTLGAPSDQPAGVYRGTVTVTADGETVAEVPVEAEVWDFTLPVKNSMSTSFALWFETVWHYMSAKGATEGENYLDLYHTYNDFLLEYRQVAAQIPDKAGSPDEYAALCEKYMEDPRFDTYRIPFWQGSYREDGTLTDPAKAYIDALDRRGILEKGFIYNFDEPNADLYDRIRDCFKATHSYNPKARSIITSSPRTSFYGVPQIWCGLIGIEPNDDVFVRERQRAGDEVWWYGCIIPEPPYPRYCLHDPLLPCRLMNWMQKSAGVTGNLFWASALNTTWDGKSWSGIYDIWSQGAPTTGSGDGRLIAAGCKGDGVVNRNIPVATMRLEAIRDGEEDYEYLTLIEKKYDAFLASHGITSTKGRRIIRMYFDPLFNSAADFATASDGLFDVRAAIAHDITARDDVLVAVLPYLTPDEPNGRVLRVFAPHGSTVLCDGKPLGETESGVFEKVFTFGNGKTGTRVSVSVDGDVYDRFVLPIDENEFRDLAFDKMFDDIDALGIPFTDGEIRQNYMMDRFDFLSHPENGKMVKYITEARDELPLIKRDIACSYSNSIPVITMTYDAPVKVGRSDSKDRILHIYAPKGASVLCDGFDTVELESGEKYVHFFAPLTLDKAGRQLVSFTVYHNGVTERFDRIVNQKEASRVVPFDPEKKTVLHIEKNDQKTEFDLASYEDIARGCNAVYFRIKNNSKGCIWIPDIKLIGDGCETVVHPAYSLLAEGRSVEVFGRIPAEGLGKKYDRCTVCHYTFAPLIDTDIEITDFRLADIPTFQIGESDVVMMYEC